MAFVNLRCVVITSLLYLQLASCGKILESAEVHVDANTPGTLLGAKESSSHGTLKTGSGRSQHVSFKLAYPTFDTAYGFKPRRTGKHRRLSLSCSPSPVCVTSKATAWPLYFQPADNSSGAGRKIVKIHNGTHMLGVKVEGENVTLAVTSLGPANDVHYQWEIIRKDDRYFKFINRATGKALQTNDSAEVHVEDESYSRHQDWRLKHTWHHLDQTRLNAVGSHFESNDLLSHPTSGPTHSPPKPVPTSAAIPK